MLGRLGRTIKGQLDGNVCDSFLSFFFCDVIAFRFFFSFVHVSLAIKLVGVIGFCGTACVRSHM